MRSGECEAKACEVFTSIVPSYNQKILMLLSGCHQCSEIDKLKDSVSNIGLLTTSVVEKGSIKWVVLLFGAF